MSLRKKLDRVIGNEVEIHVPPVDPVAQIVAGANNFGGQFQALYKERNDYKQWGERLACELEATHRHLQNVAQERDNWRRIACTQIGSNGKLKAALENVESIFHNIRNTSLEVEHLAAQLPKEQPQNDEPVDLEEEHLAQPDINPSPEDIEQIRSTLANLQGAEHARKPQGANHA